MTRRRDPLRDVHQALLAERFAPAPPRLPKDKADDIRSRGPSEQWRAHLERLALEAETDTKEQG